MDARLARQSWKADRSDQRRLARLREEVKKLPNRPGCYRYFDAQGMCLYVGKARDLRQRVSSYFQKTSSLSPRIALMVSKIVRLETTVVRSEAEALLLENNLIKELHPRYNIVFRDDKSYPYIKLSREAYPCISYYRGVVDQSHDYFGPYPNATSVRDALQVIQKVFGLRTCDKSTYQNRTRACLLGQIGRCSAPCVGMISRVDYQRDCERTKAFLDGRTRRVISRLEKRMWAASDRWEFELAARLRDRVASLTALQHQQAIESKGRMVDADIVVVKAQAGVIVLTMAMVRKGRHLGDRSFVPQGSKETRLMPSAVEYLEAFWRQHYVEQDCPSHIIFYAEGLDKRILSSWQSEITQMVGRRIQVTMDPRENRRRWLEMALENVEIAWQRRVRRQTRQSDRLADLWRVMGLEPIEDFRIECFDISHTQGEATQASCVVNINGHMKSDFYRRFTIENITGGDDYAAMRQVLRRRYARVVRGRAVLPHIVLVDGGLGQLHSAYEVFDRLGLDRSVLMGIAKGEGRKVGLETLIWEDPVTRERKRVRLGGTSPALMLFTEIRDRAHRFAITGMRQKRAKTRQISRLEDVKNVGPKRRAKLLSHFGGIKQLKNASIEDIARVDGISRTLAQRIYRAIHDAAL